MDYINVHIAGTDTDTDTDTLMMPNECLGYKFCSMGFYPFGFSRKTPHVFYKML
jgi:hypothetical protein